jgi:predicted secreted protein
MDCGIDRQPTVRVGRTRIVVLPGWIAAIVVGLFLIVQQFLLFLS